jgi:hypothetical protein
VRIFVATVIDKYAQKESQENISLQNFRGNEKFTAAQGLCRDTLFCRSVGG